MYAAIEVIGLSLYSGGTDIVKADAEPCIPHLSELAPRLDVHKCEIRWLDVIGGVGTLTAHQIQYVRLGQTFWRGFDLRQNGGCNLTCPMVRQKTVV